MTKIKSSRHETPPCLLLIRKKPKRMPTLGDHQFIEGSRSIFARRSFMVLIAYPCDAKAIRTLCSDKIYHETEIHRKILFW
jgi:hypothetical protein